jgi:hypothetical protein
VEISGVPGKRSINKKAAPSGAGSSAACSTRAAG